MKKLFATVLVFILYCNILFGQAPGLGFFTSAKVGSPTFPTTLPGLQSWHSSDYGTYYDAAAQLPATIRDVPPLYQIIGGGIIGGRSIVRGSVIPRYLYATEGVESNVYFDNAFYLYPRIAWPYGATCDVGTSDTSRWTYTPETADVPSGNTTTTAWSAASKAATLRISKATAGTGESRKLLLIGDSTGAAALTELVNLADGDALTLTTVGQRTATADDSDSESRNISYEAVGGYSWNSVKNTHAAEAGDASSQLSSWALTGHLGANTNNGILYWKLTNVIANLVLNPGFETSPSNGVFTSWSKNAGDGSAVDTEGTVVNGGAKAVKLTRATTTTYVANVFQTINVTAGVEYQLTGYARGDGTYVPRFALWDATHSAYLVSSTACGDTAAYAVFSSTFTVPSGCTSIWVWLFAPNEAAGAYGYFDDISLLPTTAGRRVELYKNSNGSAENLVAAGDRIGDGSITLAAANTSGLTGTVSAVYTGDDATLSANTLTVNFLVRAPGTGFDFDQYLTDTSLSMAADDWVIIHLGINDIFSYTTDAAVNTYLGTLDDTIDAIVGVGDTPADTTIRGAVSGIRVALCITIPPDYSEAVFIATYGEAQTLTRYRRNLQLLQEWMISTYDTAAMEAKEIHVLPYHFGIDTVNNFANAVHPAAAGYHQMGRELFAFLKYHE